MDNVKIRFLKDMAGNSNGETVKIVEEDEDAVYYNDGWNRWSYLHKSEEGIDFIYVQSKSKSR